MAACLGGIERSVFPDCDSSACGPWRSEVQSGVGNEAGESARVTGTVSSWRRPGRASLQAGVQDRPTLCGPSDSFFRANAALKPCPFKDFCLQLPKQMNNPGEAPLYPYSPDYTNPETALTTKKPELVGSGLRSELQEDYRFNLRRIAPTAPINPVPSSNRELGSGVVPPPW